MIVFTFNGNPNGQLSGSLGDKGFDLASGNPPTKVYNYFICDGGTLWIAWNASGSQSGPWQGVVSVTAI